MLDIVPSCNPMQYQGKLMIQTWENGENVILGPILACLARIWAPDLFSWVLPLLDVRYRRKLSSSAISKKTYDAKSRKYQKTSFWAWFRSVAPKFGPPNFFVSKIWLRQSLDMMVRYYHVQYQKNLMLKSWENLVTDGRTGRRADRQTNENDFIGCCQTNAERPKLW